MFVPDLHQPLHFLFLLQEKAAHSFKLLDHPRDLALVPFPDAAFVRLDALVGKVNLKRGWATPKNEFELVVLDSVGLLENPQPLLLVLPGHA